MATSLELSTRRDPDGTPVVTAVGEIDMSNADSFLDVLGQAAAGAGRLVVDLTRVEYLDSAGLHALFAHTPGLELIASPLLAPVLAISGLSDVTSVRDPQD
jgi:anti-sigma B factor antagonist